MSSDNETNATAANATPSDGLEGVVTAADIPYIDSAMLLQADTTAIVGVFILLTLRQLVRAKESTTPRNTENVLSVGRLTFALALPFAISALFIIIEGADPRRDIFFDLSAAEIFAMLGFAYIIVIFFYFFFYKRIV